MTFENASAAILTASVVTLMIVKLANDRKEDGTMAIPHAAPGQAIEIHPLGELLRGAVTKTLIKTSRLEVIRLVVPAGKSIPPHKVAGELTVQCLEGRVHFTALGQTSALGAGQMLFLPGNEEHSLQGVEDASMLVTILL
jgi:quercetin dioxygenase-like cupin family protein